MLHADKVLASPALCDCDGMVLESASLKLDTKLVHLMLLAMLVQLSTYIVSVVRHMATTAQAVGHSSQSCHAASP